MGDLGFLVIDTGILSCRHGSGLRSGGHLVWRHRRFVVQSRHSGCQCLVLIGRTQTREMTGVLPHDKCETMVLKCLISHPSPYPDGGIYMVAIRQSPKNMGLPLAICYILRISYTTMSLGTIIGLLLHPITYPH
jgi:hypothetical protein